MDEVSSEGIEEFYPRIAESMQEAIPEEWTEAKFEAIFFSDAIDYFGEYVRKQDGKPRSMGANTDDAEEAFQELREKFEAEGKPLWGHVTFELLATGKFNMKFDYENCDEDGNFIFDEDVELKRSADRRKRLST